MKVVQFILKFCATVIPGPQGYVILPVTVYLSGSDMPIYYLQVVLQKFILHGILYSIFLKDVAVGGTEQVAYFEKDLSGQEEMYILELLSQRLQ